jgi:hypothetical protein
MTKTLTKEDFDPHVGKSFRFVQANFDMPLDHIDGGEPMAGYARPPFVLIFRGPKPGPVMPEGIYDVEVESGQTFWIHVAPMLTSESDRQYYQAIMS